MFNGTEPDSPTASTALNSSSGRFSISTAPAPPKKQLSDRKLLIDNDSSDNYGSNVRLELPQSHAGIKRINRNNIHKKDC